MVTNLLVELISRQPKSIGWNNQPFSTKKKWLNQTNSVGDGNVQE
jgi:hypothetical protein